jgi:glycosyltransferase involved in cell wall biosynthesis
MRILHVENQAGVAWQLAQAQRRLGHHAVVIETYASSINLPHDLDFYYTHESLGKDISNGLKVVRFAQDFDIVHLHGGVHWKRWDALAIKLYDRRPMVVHYHGSEARDGYGMRYQFLADHKFLSRPDLLRWVPDGEYVPNPVGELPYTFDPTIRPRVVHMAVNRRTKGTDLIERVLKELADEGLDFEYVILEKVDHEEAMGELARSHFLIDQVIDPRTAGLPSIIGLASLEAMAMGKVAISSFDPEYRMYYPGCPVIAIEPTAGALKEAVRACVEDLQGTRARGLVGREYVLKAHSADEIVKRIIPVYESLVRT